MGKNQKEYSVRGARSLLKSSHGALARDGICFENIYSARESVRDAVEQLGRVMGDDVTHPGAAIILRSAHESAVHALDIMESMENVLRKEYEDRKRRRDGRGAQRVLEKIAKMARKEIEISLRYLASAQKNGMRTVDQNGDKDPVTALALVVALPIALVVLTALSFMDNRKPKPARVDTK